MLSVACPSGTICTCKSAARKVCQVLTRCKHMRSVHLSSAQFLRQAHMQKHFLRGLPERQDAAQGENLQSETGSCIASSEQFALASALKMSSFMLYAHAATRLPDVVCLPAMPIQPYFVTGHAGLPYAMPCTHQCCIMLPCHAVYPPPNAAWICHAAPSVHLPGLPHAQRQQATSIPLPESLSPVKIPGYSGGAKRGYTFQPWKGFWNDSGPFMHALLTCSPRT
eukprot:1159243-Pelagomonas_calceolata.AAC.2